MRRAQAGIAGAVGGIGTVDAVWLEADAYRGDRLRARVMLGTDGPASVGPVLSAFQELLAAAAETPGSPVAVLDVLYQECS